MEMISERSNKGKGKLIEGDDRCPSQNHLPGSDNQQQSFGGGRGTTEAAGASSSHSASEKRRPLSDFVDQIDPHRLQWPEKLHKHFVHAMEELVRCEATPKAVLEEMGVDGITQQQVKSHLQRYRKGKITETNRQVPRGPRLKNNKAGKFDASKSASTSSREHDPNGPVMGAQNVGGNLKTGTVTTPLYSAQQQHQVDVADISAANGGHFMTSNGNPFLGPYNDPTSSTAINNVQADLQIHTPGFLDHNGSFYPFQPENGNHWVLLDQYCGALQNNQQQNQPQAATDTVQAQNGIYNFRSGNEAHWVQQPALDGGNLGNIQQQNQAQAATDTVQAQNATAIMPDSMVTTEDQLEDFSNRNSSELDIADFGIVNLDFRESFGLARQNEVYDIQAGNETQMVQQPAQDGGALGNNQQQNQPQAATDTVQAQNATAIMPDNVVTTEDQYEDYFNWASYSNPDIEDF